MLLGNTTLTKWQYRKRKTNNVCRLQYITHFRWSFKKRKKKLTSDAQYICDQSCYFVSAVPWFWCFCLVTLVLPWGWGVLYELRNLIKPVFDFFLTKQFSTTEDIFALAGIGFAAVAALWASINLVEVSYRWHVSRSAAFNSEPKKVFCYNYKADKTNLLHVSFTFQVIDKLPVLPLFFELIGIVVAWVSYSPSPWGLRLHFFPSF